MGCCGKKTNTIIKYQVVTTDRTQRGELQPNRSDAESIRLVEDGDKIKPVRVAPDATAAPVR